MPTLESEPEVKEAIERLGDMDAYMRLLSVLTGKVELDEKTRNIIFGQILGHLSAEVARKSSRPWQYAALILGIALFCLVLYINNIMLQLALGVI